MTKFSSFKEQQLIFENFRNFTEDKELKPSDFVNFLLKEAVISSPEKLYIPSHSSEESGFCQFNKDINEYAASSPDALALVLIFVVASQQVAWPSLMAGFDELATFLETPASARQTFISKEGPFEKTWDGLSTGSRETTIIPSKAAPIVIGKTLSIHNIWTNRDQIFAIINPLLQDYNNSSGSRREDAAFDIYKALLGVERLGIPKAAFAMQLIIGRYGCIDSINTQLYSNIIPPGLLDKEGRIMSGDKGNKIFPGFSNLTPKLEKIAASYRDFLHAIEKETKDDVSKQLWNVWCDIVAHKIQMAGEVKGDSEFEVESPVGSGKVKYDYPGKYAKGSDTEKYQQTFKKNVTGQDVSRQHVIIPGFEGGARKLYKENLAEELQNATLDDGTPVCPACLLEVIELADGLIFEAKYHGKTVPLNKPMKGDVKKSKVYVKDPKTGNIKKVNFGDPNMKIKKNIPARRKSFRARHHCDNPGPKTKARYWSCRAW